MDSNPLGEELGAPLIRGVRMSGFRESQPSGPIWQKRFYDFNVCGTAKRIEKLRYITSEPGEARSGRKTRRVEMGQLPDVRLRRRGLGKSELSGMAAQDNVFRLAAPGYFNGAVTRYI